MKQNKRYPLTEEQIAEARKLDLFTYLQLYAPDELVHVSGNEYCTRSHDSVKISNGLWHRESTGDGGRSALDYFIKVEGYSFVNAVKMICGNSVTAPDTAKLLPVVEAQKKVKKPFVLPAANFTNNVITNYLCNERGLPKAVVDECIRRKLIYEAKDHHNVVFVGYDINRKPQFATMRGCYGKQFRHDVEGSNKAFSFSIPARDTQADILCAFEGAIDALSFLVLHEMSLCAHMLALSGVAPPKNSTRTMRKLPVALEQYLTDHPQIKHVILGLDNDEAGRKVTEEITKLLTPLGYEVHDMPPKIGKDYNDELLARRTLQREKDQCR